MNEQRSQISGNSDLKSGMVKTGRRDENTVETICDRQSSPYILEQL
jgi:hypothetical protein